MNTTIYKYKLKGAETQEVTLPWGAKILTVQSQGNEPHLWAWVSLDEKRTEQRIIEMFGTGNPIGYERARIRSYISTFQMNGGALVYHAFENSPPK